MTLYLHPATCEGRFELTVKRWPPARRSLDPVLSQLGSLLRSDPKDVAGLTTQISGMHVVVDLTGLNANVALKLGIAHTLDRNVLLVTQDSTEGHFSSLAKLVSIQ